MKKDTIIKAFEYDNEDYQNSAKLKEIKLENILYIVIMILVLILFLKISFDL